MNPRPKAVIVSAVRTPIGSFNGVLRSIPEPSSEALRLARP